MTTVDLSRQRMLLTPGAGQSGSQTEAWSQDVLARLLVLLGIERVSFEVEKPSNTSVLWYDRGQPTMGQPGKLKIWDADVGDWAVLTPERYRTHQAGIARIKVYPTAGDTVEEAPQYPREGDWWVIESEGRSYLRVGDEATGYWLDQTGAPIRISTDADNAASIGTDGGIYLDTNQSALTSNLLAAQAAATNSIEARDSSIIASLAAEAAREAAELLRDQVITDAAAAATARTDSETAKDLAALWATKIDGNVDGAEASSKAYAIGGVGVSGVAGRGSAKDWATKTVDVPVDGVEYSAKHHSAKSAQSAAAAATAQATTQGFTVTAQAAATAAQASAAAIAALVGATLCTDYADAVVKLGTIAANGYAVVVTDETKGNQITLYQKVSGVYLFRRSLADVSYSALWERMGNGTRLRAVRQVLGGRDRKGYTGPGNPDFLPRTLNLSQSGTTVTAATAFFTASHVGKTIEWASGEEAVITSVPFQTSPGVYAAAVTTCTVDRAQTVANGSAVVDAKHLVECIFGNSISHPVVRDLIRLRYRELGFGGYVFSAGNVDTTILSVGQVTYSGAGAGDSATLTDPDYATLPWSRCMLLPSGTSLIFEFVTNWVNGIERKLSHGLRFNDLISDTATVTWLRGAGALTVERQKSTWGTTTWELVDTIADTSVGTTTYVTKKYKHALGPGWRYRVTSTSGTAKVVQTQLLNRSKPGYVPWTLYTSGNDISNFIKLPAAAWGELVTQTQIDLHTFHMAGGRTGVTDPNALIADFTTYRNMWNTAAGNRPLDHLWITPWQPADIPAGTQATSKAWGDAIRIVAVTNDDSYMSFESLFGSFTALANPRGLLQDNVHPSFAGGSFGATDINRVAGISQHQFSAHGRDVNAQTVSADAMNLAGRDLSGLIASIRRGPLNRGAKWTQSSSGHLGGQIAAAIGASDFTYVFEADIAANASAVRYLGTVSNSMSALTGNNVFLVYQQGASLIIVLFNGSGVATNYTFANFGTAYGGARRLIAIRSNRASGRFELFVDGEPAFAVAPVITGTGDALPAWTGVGTNFYISQAASVAAASDYYYNAMWFGSALTDAQIAEIFVANGMASVVPDFWWDFRDQAGRIALDQSGNRRDGMWQLGSANSYALAGHPTWRGARRGLCPPWVANLNATINLFGGDDVLAKFTITTDMLLPSAPREGDRIRVTKGNVGATIRFATPALSQIRMGPGATVGTNASQIGTGGRMTLVDANSAALLMCERAEIGTAIEWAVVTVTGAVSFT